MASLSICLATAWTRRICDAELTWIQKQCVGVGNVELFFFPYQSLLAGGELLHEPLSKGIGQIFAFSSCEM